MHENLLCSPLDENVSITLDQCLDSATCQLFEQAQQYSDKKLRTLNTTEAI